MCCVLCCAVLCCAVLCDALIGGEGGIFTTSPCCVLYERRETKADPFEAQKRAALVAADRVFTDLLVPLLGKDRWVLGG